MAFLRLDRRGSGRLGAQELRMGLLIGAAVRIFRRIFMEVSPKLLGGDWNHGILWLSNTFPSSWEFHHPN